MQSMSLELPRPFRKEKIIVPPETLEVLRFRALLEQGNHPMDLEIGCGVGWHPIRYAEANPGRTLVAIEQTAEKFTKFHSRILAHQRAARSIENLLPVHADAVAWITGFVPDASLNRIFILYPNPNPKNAAARWIRMPFFGHLVNKLSVGGAITIRTNLEEYADEVRIYAKEVWKLALVMDRTFTQREVDLSAALTHFERKYLEAGERCTELVFSR